jgi:hypothetical protein
MFSKSNKPSPIDSLIGTGTTIEGNVTFTGGLRIDGHVKGNVRATGSKPGTLVISELAKVEGDIDVAHVGDQRDGGRPRKGDGVRRTAAEGESHRKCGVQVDRDPRGRDRDGTAAVRKPPEQPEGDRAQAPQR